MIEASNLSKVFTDKKRGEVRAVDGISFKCRPGSIFALLGANGAGKTTTLRMLATILTPTSGEATIAGYNVIDEPAKVRSKIGFLSGTTGVYGKLSPREMIEYFGRLYGLEDSVIKQRSEHLFDILNMRDFVNGRCDKLSTGQKQKVSIARSIIHEPPVMIFDEPTSGLDVMSSRTIMTFIENCRKQGKTIIYSTHIMSEVERLCDEIGVIHNGQIRAIGTLQQLREQTGEQNLEMVFLKLCGEGRTENGF
ncbi:MAG TPA: ATP-binding cassette domain-containing protein [Blastocatellia bacterium]|nr:ATP-binding cassette domain-containing protein [Blastocatellia bacterium]